MKPPLAKQTFRQIELKGDPGARGRRHGAGLGDEIRRVLDFYRGLFGMAEDDLLGKGQDYGEIISRFSPEYAEEIEAIAAGAGLDARLLYALNSRSEIFNNASLSECTAVFNTAEAILAQNWDWSVLMESLVVDMTIERPDGHRLRMLTEPGIIGKIGMNNAGLGVCLNILGSDERLSGLPVHVLLRAILDCRSLECVEALLERHGTGKASHILVGDRGGHCLSVEFSGRSLYRLRPESGYLLHTNHYISQPGLNTTQLFPSTHERFSRGRSMLAQRSSGEDIRRMLTNRSEGENSICRPWSPSGIPGFGDVGTVFTLLMDLGRGEMEIRKGPGADGEFYRVRI